MSTRTDALDGLLALTVVLGDDMRTSLARDGLTPSRAHVLWLLHHGGPTTQRAIADALGVSARNVTGLVDGLVAGGFVERAPHPTDRRAVLVRPTERGTTAAAAMAASHVELADPRCAGVPDREVERLRSRLADVVARLSARIAEEESRARPG